MKGRHRPSQRIVLPNGMWVLIYDDDNSLKIAGYDRKLEVFEVLNREGGGHVFVRVHNTGTPKNVAARPSDLVTVERGVMAALERVHR